MLQSSSWGAGETRLLAICGHFSLTSTILQLLIHQLGMLCNYRETAVGIHYAFMTMHRFESTRQTMKLEGESAEEDAKPLLGQGGKGRRLVVLDLRNSKPSMNIHCLKIITDEVQSCTGRCKRQKRRQKILAGRGYKTYNQASPHDECLRKRSPMEEQTLLALPTPAIRTQRKTKRR